MTTVDTKNMVCSRSVQSKGAAEERARLGSVARGDAGGDGGRQRRPLAAAVLRAQKRKLHTHT